MKLQKYISIVFFSLLIQTFTVAQCDKVGLVTASDMEGCALLIQLANGDLIEPINSDNYRLEIGQTIQFDFERSAGNLACSGNETIQLTCVEEQQEVSTQTCNFGLDIAVSGLTVTGSIFSYVDFGPYQPQEVTWFNHTTGELLGHGADISHTFSSIEAIEVITAVFKVTYEDGTTCEGIICEPIVLENSLACKAAFDYEILEDYTVQFKNISTGNFTAAAWEIGRTIGEGNVFNYAIEVPDYYEVCLKINNNRACEAEFCETVFLGTTNDLCDIEDCVYPGDANQDAMSNYLDVLEIGLGYGVTGRARAEDFSETIWSPMPATDWGIHTPNGSDYKHLDCNGDGEINEADIEVIAQNYMPTIAENVSNTTGHPNIWLKFLEESIVIDENSPKEIEILAQVMVGTNDAPIGDLYGLAFQLIYPGEMVMPYSIEVDYQTDAFLGTADEVIGLYQDLGHLGLGKIEAAYSRKNKLNTNGSGSVALVKFIIEGDIIGGRGEAESDFELSIGNVTMIDAQGQEKEVIIPAQPATIQILNQINSTDNLDKKEKVHIYPNPVTDVLTIRLEYVEGEKVEVYNAMGQLVQTQTMKAMATEVAVDELPSGVYWVKVYTDKGAASERIFVE